MLITACTEHSKQRVPYYNQADFTPVWRPVPEDSLHRIAYFCFTDQHGDSVSNRTLHGKIYLANFFFTSCPGICPKMTHTMKQVYEQFKENNQVAFVSHSVTPEEDSVPRLAAYAQQYGISGMQWHFVTGNVHDIYYLARHSYFIEEAPGLSRDSTEFLHTENMILVDGNGHIRGLYNGTLDAEVPRIAADIRALLKE